MNARNCGTLVFNTFYWSKFHDYLKLIDTRKLENYLTFPQFTKIPRIRVILCIELLHLNNSNLCHFQMCNFVYMHHSLLLRTTCDQHF